MFSLIVIHIINPQIFINQEMSNNSYPNGSPLNQDASFFPGNIPLSSVPSNQSPMQQQQQMTNNFPIMLNPYQQQSVNFPAMQVNTGMMQPVVGVLSQEQLLQQIQILQNQLSSQQISSLAQAQFNQVAVSPNIPSAPTMNDDESIRRLFVGDLSFFCTEDNLLPLFSPFGPISSISIRRGASGDSLLFGFVSYEYPQSATAALTALNGQEFMGRKLR